MPTDDKLVLGKGDNFATKTSWIVASKPDPGGEYLEFRGWPSFAILQVTPDPVIGQRPIDNTDGVTGVAMLEGAGVRGLGAPYTRREGGKEGAGTGGYGVIGHGGSGDLENNDDPEFSVRMKTYAPGFGVLGIGGWWTGPRTVGDKTRDARGAPGVVGVAGGENGSPQVPSLYEAQGVGVYGASTVGRGVVAKGANDQSGLFASGLTGVEANGLETGVFATGGLIGVNGISTRDANRFPQRGDSDFIGVKGKGGIGMDATGTSIGINALGIGGPAGVFERQKEELVSRPQIHIKPLPMWVPDPQDAETVSVFPDDGLGAQLPQFGNAGDLLMTIQGPRQDKPGVPPRPEATLWLCVVSTGEKPAVWKQVLLGPPIEGMNVGKG